MTWKTALVLVLACLLAAPAGCKKDQGIDEDPEIPADVVGQEATDPSPPVPVDPPPVAQVDESLFIKAYFEVTCVQAQIEDPTLQKRIIEEIHARYGFDNEAAYKAAEAQVSVKPNIKFALESRMKSCTKAAAESFEKAGAMVIAPSNPDEPDEPENDGVGQLTQEEDGDSGEEENPGEDTPPPVGNDPDTAPGTTDPPETKEPEEAKAPDKTPDSPKPSLAYKPGTYSDNNVREMSITGGKLTLTLSEAGKISGRFSGSRSGKSFSYSIGGTVTKKGTMSGGAGTLSFKGQANRSIASGVFTGVIHGARFSTAFKANR